MSFEEFKEKYFAKLEGTTWYGEKVEVTDLELLKLFVSHLVISDLYQEVAKKEKRRK